MIRVIAAFFFLIITLFESNAAESGDFESLHSLIREIGIRKFVNKSKTEVIYILMDSLSMTFSLNYKVSYSDSLIKIETDNEATIYDCDKEEDLSDILSFLANYSSKMDSVLKSYGINFELEYYLCDFLLSKIDKSANSRIITSQYLGKSVPREYDFEYIKDEKNEYKISSIKTNLCSVQESGIKIGDIIESIDSIPSRYLTNNLVNSLLFDKDSVDFTILTDEGLRNVRLKSKRVEQNISFTVSEINRRTLYVKIYNFFGKDIAKEIGQRIVARDPRRLIIDIRNNHGGKMGEMIDFLSLFLNNEVPVVSVECANNAYKYTYVSHLNKPVRIPELIILINHSTASGANIVAEVLRKRCNAFIAGENSYGINEIHTVVPLYPGKYFANLLVGSFALIGFHDSLELGISPDHYIMDCYGEGDSILDFSISASLQNEK
jgi:hypothetical protein